MTALKRANAMILLVPTLGTLLLHGHGVQLLQLAGVRVSGSTRARQEFGVEYIFEAQAAIQNAEVCSVPNRGWCRVRQQQRREPAPPLPPSRPCVNVRGARIHRTTACQCRHCVSGPSGR